MEMITGALLMLCLILAYDKFKPHNSKEVEDIDDREKERQKAYDEHWDHVFNYTPEIAYKKVTR